MNRRQASRKGGKEKGRSLNFSINFHTSQGRIDPNLLDSTAKKAAKVVADCNSRVNKSTQVRRFYDELAMWQERIGDDQDRFEELLPFVRMLKAKAAYAEGRELVDGAFVDLLNQIIDFAKSPSQLMTAKLFFEAFLGFYRLERGDN